MNGVPYKSWIVALALGVALPSCNRKKVAAPPAAPAAVVLPKREPPKPPTLPPAPKIATTPPAESPVNVEVTTAAPPPKPAPPQKKRGRVAKKKEAAPPPQEVKTAEARIDPNDPTAGHTPTPATPAPATPSGLKLGQILTPEQTKDFLKRFDSSTERARGVILIMQGKILNDEQKETVGRIKAFLDQAVSTKDQDLVNAVSLAERADLLSKDLTDRIK